MDGWKYHYITGRYLDLLNPCDPAKLDRLFELMDLADGARVLDMGSGKGEALLRLARRRRVFGVGVDISPYFTEAALTQARALGDAGSGLNFLAMDGRDYQGNRDFDAVLCLGASWIFGGMRGTAHAMSTFARPGGLIAIGEPHLIRPPSCEYLRALAELDREPEAELTLFENVSEAEACGLVTLASLASSQDEYDSYEWQRMRAAEQYALEHPEDPDVPELLRRARTHRDLYLRYAREVVGWSLYLFKKVPAVGR
jgi:cyclopropane fatty-acyl-phospholipid synthase-like methyltransferase